MGRGTHPVPRALRLGRQASACRAFAQMRRLRAPHIPSPDVRLRPTNPPAADRCPATAHSDLPAPAGAPPLGHPACAGQLRRRAGHGEPEASSNESPRRKPRGCPGGETLRVFPSAHASGFQTGRLGVTPAVEPAYLTSAGRMPKRRRSRRRRQIRVSRSLEGEGERPARRYGVTPSRIGRVRA